MDHGLQGILMTLLGHLKSQKDFVIILLLFFSPVLAFELMMQKAMVGKTAGLSTRNKAVAPK